MPSGEDLDFGQNLIKLIPYFPQAETSIQIVVQELNSGSIINWDIIRDVLSQLKPLSFPRIFNGRSSASTCIKYFEQFIFRLLGLFDMHKCTDKSVIADVLELLCIVRCTTYTNANYAEWMKHRFHKNNGQKSMSTFEKSLLFAYNDTISLTPSIWESGVTSSRNWVEHLVANGEVDLLKAIISHGATLIVPHEAVFYLGRITCFIYKVLYKATPNPLMEDETEFWLRRINYNLGYKFENHNKRLYFALIILANFTDYRFRKKTDDYIQCARIFLRSTPEPLITSEEIESVLTKLCSGIVPKEKVLQFVKKYESYFPESLEVSTPRTLTHLSRFQVRECLRTAGSFPHGVKLLSVPKKIQDYIFMKDILI